MERTALLARLAESPLSVEEGREHFPTTSALRMAISRLRKDGASIVLIPGPIPRYHLLAKPGSLQPHIYPEP